MEKRLQIDFTFFHFFTMLHIDYISLSGHGCLDASLLPRCCHDVAAAVYRCIKPNLS